MRYLKSTSNFGLFYRKGGNEERNAFTDTDYAGAIEDRLLVIYLNCGDSIYGRSITCCYQFLYQLSNMDKKGFEATRSCST